MKEYRGLIQAGQLFRLTSPFEKDGNEAAWEVISEDGNKILIAYFRILQRPEAPYTRLSLRGLNEKDIYACREVEKCCELNREEFSVYRTGSEWMNIGLILSDESSGCAGKASDIQGDFLARMFLLEKKQPENER